jgi:NAD(P)-dependent dehydrogenase (short-subunit alcohol dehydrogenase family)
LVRGGREAIDIACEVTNEAEMKAMAEQTVAAFGRLDAAFNEARVNSVAIRTADGSSFFHVGR